MSLSYSLNLFYFILDPLKAGDNWVQDLVEKAVGWFYPKSNPNPELGFTWCLTTEKLLHWHRSVDFIYQNVPIPIFHQKFWFSASWFSQIPVDHLNTWTLEYLNTWTLELLNTWILKYLNNWILECLNTWIREYLNTWIIEYLNT